MKRVIVATLMSLLWSVPKIASSQAVYGSVVGTVTDSSSGRVPNAKITVRDVGKGISFETSSNDAGNYSQTHLIVGTYEVRVEVPGFQTAVQQNITVEVDKTTEVDVVLRPGTVGEVVNVTGESPVLKTEKSDVSDTLAQKAIQELPVFSRDLNRLFFQIPGFQATGTTGASEQPQDIYRPTVGGQYWGGISFQLDGTDNRDSVLGEPVISPNLDSIADLKITTGAYDAEFGQASQAVITTTTKSGSNQWHGSAFEYRRDQHGAARDPFAQSVPLAGTSGRYIPVTIWNQFGGSLGLPIQKDKTFLFGDYQGSRQKNGGSQLVRVPTLAERNGDLSDLATPIYNPCAGTNCNVLPANRQQFPGAVIPSTLITPQAKALLAYIPLPNVPGVTGNTPNFAASGFGINNSDSFNVRGDRYQNEKLHLFGRYSFLNVNQNAPGAFGYAAGGPHYANITYAGQSALRSQSLAVGLDYIIRPDWLEDFRFGWFHYGVQVNPNGLGTSPAKDAGIPGLNLDSTYTSGMPAFTLNGTGLHVRILARSKCL